MRINVLDHGYVEFIEAWGTGKAGAGKINIGHDNEEYPDYECGIIEAARQSTQGAFRGWDEDMKLLRHLFNNRPPHAGPFEFAGMVVEVQAPLFVFREWHRHRTQSYNEMSARYAPLPELYYKPDVLHAQDRAQRARHTKNKQLQAASGAQQLGDLTGVEIEQWIKSGWELNETLENHYQSGLKIGVPKELARIHMPVNHYSRMRAVANLRNWLAFMTLRCDEGVQWETQQYAWAVAQCIQAHFPRTSELWALKQHREDTPAAWIRGRISHTPDGDDYDEEVVPGSEQPAGEGWKPLYAR